MIRSWAQAVGCNHMPYTRKRSLPPQAHENVAAFASAYSLGKTESAAALNLLNKIPKDVKQILTDLVRTVGSNHVEVNGTISPLFPDWPATEGPTR